MGLVASSYSSSSSSSSSPSGCPATSNHNQHQWKHDVFLSFRGEDTRDNFISHLHAALSEKGLETFIDYKLRKGDEIAPTLLRAIEESKVAVVVFSKNFASSSWCLDELVKIMECREMRGLIVIPVFYNVNPSDVRKQIGTFTFDRKRKQNFQTNLDKVPKWKAALTGAADLSGWDSNVIRLESLPELPASLLELDARACLSLENISSLIRLFSDRRSQIRTVNLSDCFKRHKLEGDPISQLGIHYLAKCLARNYDEKLLPEIFVRYTGGRIPEWCVNRCRGDTVRVPLPSNWLNNDPYLGFIICLVVGWKFLYRKIQIQCNCHFGDNCDDGCDFTFVLNEKCELASWLDIREHVMLFTCNLHGMIAENRPGLTQCWYDAVWFNFKPIEPTGYPSFHQFDCEVKSCGAIPLYP